MRMRHASFAQQNCKTVHVEAGRHGAIGVQGGLYGINGGEVCGGALLHAVSATGVTRGVADGARSAHLCWQYCRSGPEFSKYSTQDGASPPPEVYLA
jgi:hypothetical protein